MSRIIPIRDLRDTNKITNMCKESSEPIYITKNGYGEMVLMSVDAYDDVMHRIEMFKKILAGKNQADEGKLLNGDEALDEIGKQYGLV